MEEKSIFDAIIVLTVILFFYFAVFGKNSIVKKIGRWILGLATILSTIHILIRLDCGGLSILGGTYVGCNIVPDYLANLLGHFFIILIIFGMILVPLIILICLIAEFEYFKSKQSKSAE